MKSIVLLAAAAAALVATGMAGADGVGSSATGGVHLTVHDVFGLPMSTRSFAPGT